MTYNNDFYKRYKEYLEEPEVRKSHDMALDCFSLIGDKVVSSAIDFGCGTGEFRDYFVYKDMTYVGVDVVNSPAASIVMDYTKELPDVDTNPDTFVSLFSIEACLPIKDRTPLYEKIFLKYPSIKIALVSGFYYEDKQDQESVIETGELKSYQTITRLVDETSDIFSEARLVMRTPSDLFGENVIEVWRMLERKII